MILKQLKPRKALNKAYLKLKPDRKKIDIFKTNLIELLDTINESESEENQKNLISDFLKNTYYKDDHFINTKERADLVIHNGKNRASTVGVIIETKRPSNRWEMITPDEINAKAFHELLLYYLRERITNSNLEIRNLIITNIYEWYIFDSKVFERNFVQNKALIRQFEEFEKSKQRTEVFFSDIAHPYIESLKSEIEFTYFDIRDYNQPLRNDNVDDDIKLIALYKLLSPEHLLNLPFANDSNTLDKGFYGELLHIMGLSESKEGGKKIIGREQENKRNIGSLIENAINELDSLDKISRLDKPSQYGANKQERLFNVGLELSITWMNRILFMKLLEAQLIKYHKANTQYEFLNIKKVPSYDDLNSLFFKVLARKLSDRGVTTKGAFDKVPYLNSSLFEPTELEHTTLFVSNLGDNRELPIYNGTVLKDINGKRRTGKMNPLEYLFEFLDAYDFTSEGSEAIQEDNKTLINASVLGLIFEKINGYKDGSFFTPGFITMYMCRETIRKAVLQKFNETKQWNCKDITQLYNRIDDINEANEIVNSIKICDPAVGSGHFLVSALNEIIAIKNDLRILKDRKGRRLKEYHVVVENDELIITDEDGVIFEYNPTSKESQRVQEALFHEKQTIIENCLFGVDINPNSVKICRLRLWIELLKNAYYKNETELETLPNIDINIKCGNSLVSRFALDANLGQALKKSKWTIDSYRLAVSTYRNAHNKEEKRDMEQLMISIKNDFRSEIADNDPKVKRLAKIKGELIFLTTQTSLFEQTKKEKKEWDNKVDKLTKEIKKLETEIEEIKANKIYENAFEWRFEFPEVLNDEGDFVGFDVVIGNPPYFQIQYSDYSKNEYFKSYNTFERTGDIYSLFFEKSIMLLKKLGILTFITSNRFCNTNYGLSTRRFLTKYKLLELINFNNVDIFNEANVGTLITSLQKENVNVVNKFKSFQINDLSTAQELNKYASGIEKDANQKYFNKEQWIFAENKILDLKYKIQNKSILLSEVSDLKINRGLTTGANKIFIVTKKIGDQLISKNPYNADIIKPVLKGAEIKRFEVQNFNNYIILTKTGVDISTYPDIYEYLLEYKNELEKVYEAKKGMKKWYELRACSYYNSFEDEKLIWTRLSSINSFAISSGKEYSIDSTSFATGKNLKYYCAILNSKLIYFYFKLGSVIWGRDGIKWFGEYFDSIPIIRLDNEEMMLPFIDLYDKIVEEKQQNPTADTTSLESETDQLVYALYELTDEEIEIVENA
ncbi:MAG: class I SAM-dependent DNA methyltransferase [Fermentimonas sp.]|nr:class I SAM-dependent DNA methyltransferase [Fermentimonas sp.]